MIESTQSHELMAQFEKDFPEAFALIGANPLHAWLGKRLKEASTPTEVSTTMPRPWQELHEESCEASTCGFPDKTVTDYMQDEIDALRGVILHQNEAASVLERNKGRLMGRLNLESGATSGALEALNEEHLAQRNVLLALLQETQEQTELPYSASLSKRIKAVLTANPNIVTNIDLLTALTEACSVLQSMNTGPAHRITITSDDEPVYWQRQDWVQWATNDVLPQVQAVLAGVTGEKEQPILESAAVKESSNG